MLEWLSSEIPYFLAFATFAAGALDLYHRWGELKDKPLRKFVPTLFMLIGVLSLLSVHHDNTDKQKAEQTAEQNIHDLTTQVKVATGAEQTAIQNQKDNTITFLQKFHELSGELADLKTQAKTEELQKKIAGLQTQLQNTQKALAPAPKAELLFTFVPFINTPVTQAPTPVTDVTLPVSEDGSVHVKFTVANWTAVDALDGEITLVICEQCKFAREPANFSKLEGEREVHRLMNFDRILPATFLPTQEVDVIIPPHIQSFAVGISYRCRTCAFQLTASKGVVHVIRP